MQIDLDSAQVRFPPPLLLIIFVSLGIGMHWMIPMQLGTLGNHGIFAGIFIVSGIAIILYCAGHFRMLKTNIKPWKSTSRLVTTGIYRYSRNPIYLSFVLIGLGFSVAFNSLWIALLQIPFILTISIFVIRKEEKYLEQKFGFEYLSYKNRVRKWI